MYNLLVQDLYPMELIGLFWDCLGDFLLRGVTFVYREINNSKCHKVEQLLHFSKFCSFIPWTLNMLKLCFLNRSSNRQPHTQEFFPTTSHFGSLQAHCFLCFRFAFLSVWLKPVTSFLTPSFSWTKKCQIVCLISFFSEQTHVWYSLKMAFTSSRLPQHSGRK